MRLRQAKRDDIKNLGGQMGHWMSIYPAMWDTSLESDVQISWMSRKHTLMNLFV